MRILPILFNTDMVRAILEDRKSVTRRVLKGYALEHLEIDTDGSVIGVYDQNEGGVRSILDYSPYLSGDILYVRETWTKLWYVDPDGYTHYDQPMYYYAADGTPDITLMDEDGFELDDQRIRWHPSIHMPKEAARLFLRVTDVRVERLQDMTEEDAFAEGYEGKAWCEHLAYENYPDSPIPCYAAGNPGCPSDPPCNHSIPELFGMEIWDSTIPRKLLPLYGWTANPWVRVIEFERISKEDALEGGDNNAVEGLR